MLRGGFFFPLQYYVTDASQCGYENEIGCVWLDYFPNRRSSEEEQGRTVLRLLLSKNNAVYVPRIRSGGKAVLSLEVAFRTLNIEGSYPSGPAIFPA